MTELVIRAAGPVVGVGRVGAEVVGAAVAGARPWRRGKIVGFSAASRKRLLWRVGELMEGSGATGFLSLTVPLEAGGWDASEMKSWFREFVRRWGRRCSRECGVGFGLVWKVEMHESGRVHVHAVVFGRGGEWLVRQSRKELAESWAAVVGVDPDRPGFREVAVDLERPGSDAAVSGYILKELGKGLAGLQRPVGRVWGVLGGKWLVGRMRVVRVRLDRWVAVLERVRDAQVAAWRLPVPCDRGLVPWMTIDVELARQV